MGHAGRAGLAVRARSRAACRRGRTAAVQVSKSGQGNEKLRYANGDEFEGPMQYLHTVFNPVGQGKYRVAATGALYTGVDCQTARRALRHPEGALCLAEAGTQVGWKAPSVDPELGRKFSRRPARRRGHGNDAQRQRDSRCVHARARA